MTETTKPSNPKDEIGSSGWFEENDLHLEHGCGKCQLDMEAIRELLGTQPPREPIGEPPVFEVGQRVIVACARYTGPGVVGQVRLDGKCVIEPDGGVVTWSQGQWFVDVTPWIGTWEGGGYLHSNTWRYPAESIRPAFPNPADPTPCAGMRENCDRCMDALECDGGPRAETQPTTAR